MRNLKTEGYFVYYVPCEIWLLILIYFVGTWLSGILPLTLKKKLRIGLQNVPGNCAYILKTYAANNWLDQIQPTGSTSADGERLLSAQ